MFRKPSVSLCVPGDFSFCGMRRPVDLNHEARSAAKKIRDIGTARLLPAKMQAAEAMAA